MEREREEAAVEARRRALDEAKRILVRCLEAEHGAEGTAHDTQRLIARQTEAAADLSGSDEDVETFARWLPGVRHQLEEERRLLNGLQAETARARAELAACQAALAALGEPPHENIPPVATAE